jgi:imidazolonepropionase-like amidohydrolase
MNINNFFTILLISFCFNALDAQYDVLIKNVTIIPMHSNVELKNQTVGISENKIKFIGQDSKKTGINTIDGSGKYLMPSLYDMHVHWPTEHTERFFQLQLLAGVTTNRIMKSQPDALKFKRSFQAFSPRLFVAYNNLRSDVFDSINVEAKIDSLRKEGYDFMKTFSIRSEAKFDALMKAAKKKKFTVCGHFLGNVPTEKLIASGYKSIEHVGLDGIKIAITRDSMIDLVAKHKTYICPTLDWDNMVYHSYPEDKLSERNGYAIGKKLYNIEWDTNYQKVNIELGNKLDQYKKMMSVRLENKIKTLQSMHKKGISIIAGSDAEEPYQTPGFSLIDELLLIQRAGLTNFDLLKTCTVIPAAYLEETKTHGSIEKNKVANLILLNKSPLEDIKNLASVVIVIKDGKVIDCTQLIKMIK